MASYQGMKHLALLIFPLLFAAPALAESHFTYSGDPRIVDGDSLTFGNTELRLLCLDAVELHQSCADASGQPFPCGELAKQAMIAAIDGQHVRCYGKAHDKYMRPLVRCKAGKRDLSRAMIEQGWAISTCRKTAKYEHEAREAQRGIWQGTFEIPRDWRREHPRK